MSNARNLADLLGSTGDVKASALDNVPVHADVTTSATGLMTASDKTKMDGIENNAKDDQTKSDIEGLGIAASSITGALPVIDGSNLTGIDSVVKGTSLPDPVSAESTLFYNTVADALYVSRGTSWALLTNPAPETTGGTVTIIATTEAAGTFSYDLGTDFADADDADSALTYTLVSGTLPGGATLPTTGNTAFTGTAASVSGNVVYSFTIGATDTVGGISTQNYQQQVNSVIPSATGGTVAIAQSVAGFAADAFDVDAQFTYVTGATFSAYAIQAGALPTGLSLNTSTGVISGTNGANASDVTYNFTVRATDTDGDTVDQVYSWEIISSIAPTVTGGTVTISATAEASSASYDVDTNFTFAAGHTISAFTVQSGALPSGLSLNSTSGVISGTMGNVSSNTAYNFTIRGTNTTGTSADQDYAWTINQVVPTSTGGTVTISSIQEGSSASYDVDTNFTFTTGSAFSAYSVLSGSLPSGLSLNTSTGVINGTMGTVSSDTAYTFTIRGTDTDGDTVDQGYSWTTTNDPSYSLDYLVVAGGGGGHNGGGGAGGYRNSYNSETSGGGGSSETAILAGLSVVYTVTVGTAGGFWSWGSGIAPGNGGDSIIAGSGIATVTSVGGGAGYNNGGSGGGGGNPNAGGSGTVNQGYGGGSASSTYQPGGGGGASAVGQNYTGGNPGDGGAGRSSSITGASVTRAGGGGAAGTPYGGYGPAGAGGSGGGGIGGYYSGVGGNGSTNTGSGGGGGSLNSNGTLVSNAGSGGSGVVILRMLTASYSGTTTGSPSVSTSGTDTILTFNGNGTYTG